MSEIYKVKVNDLFEFEIDAATIAELDAISMGTSKFHVLKSQTSQLAEIVNSRFQQKSYTVKVNNNSYEVTIHNALDQLIQAMGFEVGVNKKVNDIKAPMPGLILEVNVSEGMTVKENDPLLILEAMKMENVLTSPRDGTIKSISVQKGDAVEKNQLLIEFLSE